jgi:type I restriction enzyme R subunit
MTQLDRNEADTRAELIDPALNSKEWITGTVVREYQFTDGRKIIGGKRGDILKVDYLLKYNNINLAVIEAKRERLHPTEGLEQVKNYATKLKLPIVYSTNGHKIYKFDMRTGRGDYIDNYPTPQELYREIYHKNDTKDKLLEQPYHSIGSMKPRYYQEIAINKTLEAISENKNRILLTLATGTGKTYIAFQIAYKLFMSKWNRTNKDRRPKILFLADRNVLIDQAMNTFNPIENEIIKIDGSEIKRRGGIVPTNANIFFAIYQAIAEREDIGGYYKDYDKDFFDLIIIDECHRGSATEDGSWRTILQHFTSAIHLGLTATPKRKDNVDTYGYFGEPIYEYSLKDGINDGFLTPYKVKRVHTDIDEYVLDEKEIVSIQGELDNKGIYTIKDFEKNIIIQDRTELIAKEILNLINQNDKTIIFCVNQQHALDLRDSINKFKTSNDPDYCVRITSDEGEIGRSKLRQFQDNDKTIPTILTSSKMLTTGVDARNVRNIILTAPIASMVEFKQIVGRGTRIFDGKDFFTIIDFVGATNLFYDKDWDGEPEDKTETTGKKGNAGKGKGTGGENNPEPSTPQDPPKPINKIEVKLKNGRKVKITNIETRYVGVDGKPLTASEFLDMILDKVPTLYKDENQLRQIWSNPKTREELLIKMSKYGLDPESLNLLKELFSANDSDIFDILSHISFSKEILTRGERIAKANFDEEFFDKIHSPKAKEFLEFVLDMYKEYGVSELGSKSLPNLIERSKLHTIKDAINEFGTPVNLNNYYNGLQQKLYKV